MVISDKLFPIISIVIVLMYILYLFFGYKKGFLLQLIDLLSLFISLIVAWLISPILSDWFMLIPENLFEIDVYVKQFFMSIFNNLLWFIIVFALCKFILLIIRPLVKGIGRLPIIKSINGFLGSLFAIVQMTIYVFILMIILQLPFFVNGQECIDNTILKIVNKYSNEVISFINGPLLENEKIQDLMQHLNELSENDRKDLVELLDKYNINKESLESIN